MLPEDLISVIIPIYNVDQYVGYCIESVIKQSYQNLEIILVDDGSTDRSSDLCDLYASKDPRIKVIHKPNGGLVSARKAGAEIASGNFIGYVDGDDWIEPDFYEVLHRAAVRAEADVVCAGYSRDLFSKHVKCSNNVLDGIYEGAGLEKLYSRMMCYDDHFSFGITTYVWNKLFKAELVKPLQSAVDERITIGEDAAVTYPALLRAQRVYVCDNNSYHYRQREGSMLKQHARLNTEINQIKYLYNYLKDEFSVSCYADILLPKLDECILGFFIMRSGGILDHGEETAYGVSFENKKVVIIQAGTFGQLLYNRIQRTQYCSVVGWFDEDYWEYRRSGMNIDDISCIKNLDFEYALIAKVDNGINDAIRKSLHAFQIEESKILSIDFSSLQKKEFLKKFLEII